VRSFLVLLLVLPAARASTGGEVAGATGGEVSDADVARAIERARAVVLAGKRFAGEEGEGARALALLAALAAGADASEERIERSLDALAARGPAEAGADKYKAVYLASLANQCFARVREARYRDAANFMTARLIALREAKTGGWGDLSRTQFALAGLDAAESFGIRVPREVWAGAERFVAACQRKDGAFRYGRGEKKAGTGSMTAAGAACLALCRARAGRPQACVARAEDARVAAARAWLAQHFTVLVNPGSEAQWHLYYLHALGHWGSLSGERRLAGRDWFREAAAELVRTQRADGSWKETGDGAFSTEFALLFLARGAAPTLIAKARWGGADKGARWHERDAARWVELVRRELGT